ncbi:MAG: metallophosphoesterase [Ferruginibacter sp.]
MKRRNFIQRLSALSVAAVVSPALIAATNEKEESKKDFLKIAFLSDTHVKPTETAEQGMRRAFRHANNLQPKPAFIINGGDSIMDALQADKAKTQAQWDVWNKVILSENKLPMYHCIGNHDIWGWQSKDESVKQDPLYEKAWVIQEHKMPGRYYSFEKDNWHFIILDSTQENNDGYIARIDEPQYAWLEMELKSVDSQKFICIVSHIPIISFCSVMFSEKNEPNGDFKTSRALLHTDTRRLKLLFSKYPNIKTCLSGHIHLQDEVEYLGIKYFCNGAVSGNWWGGPFQEFAPAYALFKFHHDGNVEREMQEYDKAKNA